MKLLKSFTKSGDQLTIGKVDTVIGPSTVFVGKLETKNSVYIEGIFKGQLGAQGSVTVNQNSTVDADITAEYVAIHGKVTGNVSVQKQLDIAATGVLKGDVQSPSVSIAKGGILDGFCKMLKNDLKPGEVQPPLPFEEVDEFDVEDEEEAILKPMESDEPVSMGGERKRIHIIDDEDVVNRGFSGTQTEKN
jgi:cytoskeletal protein CcmA (bactofilin family)